MRLVLFVIVVLLAGAYVGWPYYTLYRIHVALAAGDTAALDELVDWASVRAAMEREIAARNQDATGAAAREPGGGLAALVAPRVGQFLADAHASPRGLARLIRDNGAAPQPAAGPDGEVGQAAAADNQPAEPFRPDVVAAMAYARDRVESAKDRAVEEYRGLRRDYDYLFFTDLYTFEARHALRAPDQSEPLVLILRLRDLRWRLVQVDLPRSRADEGG